MIGWFFSATLPISGSHKSATTFETFKAFLWHNLPLFDWLIKYISYWFSSEVEKCKKKKNLVTLELLVFLFFCFLLTRRSFRVVWWSKEVGCFKGFLMGFAGFWWVFNAFLSTIHTSDKTHIISFTQRTFFWLRLYISVYRVHENSH